jgi:hypothetical protein
MAVKNGRPPMSRTENLDALLNGTPGLGASLQEWLDFYEPASPGEHVLIEHVVYAIEERQRVLVAQAATLKLAIRTVRRRFEIEQEDQVEEARNLFATDPARAVLLLRRTALGCRWMISRLSRLQSLLEQDGTLYGNDRNELIELHGAEAYSDTLFRSEGAYLTWLYCLLAEPAPAEEAIAEMGGELRLPVSLRDRETKTWLPPGKVCRELLREQVAEALAGLRQREEHLRLTVEEPARASAEQQAQVLARSEAARFEPALRLHTQNLHRALRGFHQLRDKPGPAGRGSPAPPRGSRPQSNRRSVEGVIAGPDGPACPVRRAAPAPAPAVPSDRDPPAPPAPSPADGIGAPIFRGDRFLEVIAEQMSEWTSNGDDETGQG